LPIYFPTLSRYITVLVKDDDPGRDDIIGKLSIDLSKIRQGKKYETPTFFDLYGPVSMVSAEKFPFLKSSWHGRIQLQFSCFEKLHPVKKIKHFDG